MSSLHRWIIVVALLVLCAGQGPARAAASGTVWAWGSNYNGQLGNGNTADSRVPIAVSNLSGVTAIAAGGFYSLVLKSDGTVWAWGYNGYGQLGTGTQTDSLVPVRVDNLSGVVAVAAGYGHSLALKGDGTVWAWGSNFSGELGNGTTGDYSPVPVAVSSLSGVTAVAAGVGGHSLALTGDGTVYVWGDNSSGQLGNNTTGNSNIPLAVSNLSGVTAIAAGTLHSLALKSDGTVWAWGYNAYGQLGTGTGTDSLVPVKVDNLNGAVAVAAGYGHSLALKGDGTVWAWGNDDYGQLGNGVWIDSPVPLMVGNLSGVAAIAAGARHSLAMKNDGTVWAWGLGWSGQLGDGIGNNSKVPVEVSNLNHAIAIAGGWWHSLAIRDSPATSAQPDLQILTWEEYSYTGDNIYNTAGANQTLSVEVSTGSSAYFFIKIQNDGNESESFIVTGPAGGSGWSVRYTTSTTYYDDITSQMTGSGWQTGLLLPGADMEVLVEVVPDSTVTAGSSKDLLVTATSVSDAAKTDAVKAITSIPAMHDVALPWFTATPNPVSRRKTVSFNYTVQNQGNVSEGGLTLQLLENGAVLASQSVGSLGAGESVSKSLKVKVPSSANPGDHYITGQVVAVSGETNAANNKATVKVKVK